MKNRLEVSWEGTAPGLESHRLSLGSFGDALSKMLLALRRVATSVWREAYGDADECAPGGRLPDIAKWLDLELVELRPGSLGLQFECQLRVPPGTNLEIIDLEGTTLQRFFEALEEERQGRPRSKPVRDFLRAIPEGVVSQQYRHSQGEKTIRQVGFTEAHLISDESAPAYSLVELTGNVIGVGFEPGGNEVKLRRGKDTLNATASADQVEAAWQLRGEDVCALVVVGGKKPRLLRIARCDGRPIELSEEERNRHLFEKWGPLLERLAK